MKQLIGILFVTLLLAIVQPWSAVAAPEEKLMVELVEPVKSRSLLGRVASTGLPPLPRSCGTGSIPIDDYSQPVCCVNGYVYFNGQPVAGAQVTISANGQSVTVTTQTPSANGDPYFTASLSSAPLNVEPGDTVTLEALFEGQTKQVTFEAQAGGQQVDVVLPQTTITSTWQRLNIPYLRNSSMVYADNEQAIILFGGNVTMSSSTSIDETWAWNGTDWQQIIPFQSPPVRQEHTIAYDAPRGRIVLFGGYSFEGGTHQFLNDTWEWDGTNWQQIFPPQSPLGRHQHSMAYDVQHERVVLFGGYGRNYNVQQFLNDTWEWDGTNWQQIFPPQSPSARYQHSMAYDAQRGRVVLFGGYNDHIGRMNDIWEWDGTNWQQLFPPQSPSARVGHSMAYDAQRGRIVLFGGYSIDGIHPFLNDTWEWDGTNWQQIFPPQSPSGRVGHLMAYDVQSGRVVLFGGSNISGEYLNDTWAWDGTTWELLDDQSNLPQDVYLAVTEDVAGNLFILSGDGVTTLRTENQWQPLNTTPPFSPTVTGFQLATSTMTDQHLLFGGQSINSPTTFLNQTWLFDGNDWQQQAPTISPSARKNHALSYDASRNMWVLFGGLNNAQYFGDTWEYDGTTWTLVTTNGPTPRAGSTLLYDPNQQKTILFGGVSLASKHHDIWEWDGQTWQEITPTTGSIPPARSGHSAVYDSLRQVLVIAGGKDSTSANLTDTWEWNGSYWQERIVLEAISTGLAEDGGMVYDATNDLIWAVGRDGFYRHIVLGTPLDANPIATISRVQPRDARQNSDVIRFDGLGADGDATDIITAYRWMNGDQILSTQAVFTTTADIFDLGAHTITLEVQDNEGNWSAPVAQTIYIRDDSGSTGPTNDTWTLLLYVVADNNLDPYLGTSQTLNGMLHRLQIAQPQPNVKVAILYDGPEANDTYRYVLNEDSVWSAEHVGEAQMDNPATLEQFVTWGYDTFFTDYYALAMIDHANGVVGFGQDLTTDGSGNAFLTPSEIRSALQGALDDGARTLDVVHFDGCSFGLFENAAIVDGLAQYIIASPNTGWGIFAYDIYRQKASTAATPREYTLDVAAEYAVGVQIAGLPYTISVHDMGQFAATNEAISTFGTTLLAYIEETDTANRRTIVRQLRDASQKYDSGGTNRLEIDVEDSYVDIVDFAQRVQTLGNPALTQAAQQVETAVSTGSSPFIIYTAHQSGQFDYYDPVLGQMRPFNVDLDNANGLAVFYPPRYTLNPNTAYYNYVTHQLFNNTRDSGWTEFLAQGLPPQLIIDPPPLPSDFLIEPLVNVGETGSPIIVSVMPTLTSGTVGMPITVTIEVQSLDGMFDGASFALDFDPAVLQVEAVNLGTALDQPLLNEFDNTLGTIDVAVGTLGEPVTGTFTVASIRFMPQVDTAGTPLNLVQDNERQTGVTFDGHFLPMQLRQGAVVVTSSAVTARVNLQGRPAPPDASWSVPVHIRFYDPSTSNLLYEFATSTDTMGEAILPGVAPGMYEVAVKNPQTLQNRLPVTVTIGGNLLDLGTLRAGDANDDNLIILDDFSILRSTFDLCAGSPEYDGRADFNGNGCVQLTDFSLLAMNFGSAGQLRQAQVNLNALDVPTPFASLVVIPETRTVSAGELVTVTIAVETNQAVDGAAAYLEFDPNLLEAKGLEPGTQLPLNLTQKVDNEAGIISFAAGTLQNFPSASFTLVTIIFEAKETNGLSTLKLATAMPHMSDVTAQGYSVLLDTLDGQIQVGRDMYELFLPTITRP